MLADSGGVIGIGPLDAPAWLRVIIWLTAYVIAVLGSTPFFELFGPLKPLPKDEPQAEGGKRATTDSAKSIADAGALIGRCENIIVVTLVVLGEFSALGLVFAAKGIAQQKNISDNPSYYLGGTLVNFVWSMGIGLIARSILIGL